MYNASYVPKSFIGSPLYGHFCFPFNNFEKLIDDRFLALKFLSRRQTELKRLFCRVHAARAT